MKAISLKLVIGVLVLLVFACEKKDDDATDRPVLLKNVKITYEISSSADAESNTGQNQIIYCDMSGNYHSDTFTGNYWKKEITMPEQKEREITFIVDLILRGEGATAQGKLYIDDVLKANATSELVQQTTGRTEVYLSLSYTHH